MKYDTADSAFGRAGERECIQLFKTPKEPPYSNFKRLFRGRGCSEYTYASSLESTADKGFPDGYDYSARSLALIRALYIDRSSSYFWVIHAG